MPQSALIDQGDTPSREALVDVLGSASILWDDLTRRLTDVMGATGSWTWGGPKHGWELRFKRGGRPFTTLAPHPDAFSALVILGRKEADRAASLRLGERARRTFDEARQYHDGRWPFLSVASPSDRADVEMLLTEKLPSRIERRSSA